MRAEGRGRQTCSDPTLRGCRPGVWRHLGEDHEAGLSELTLSSGLTGRKAHSGGLGLARSQSLLALLGTSLGLQGASAALHTLGEAEVAVVGTVVEVSQPRQGQDVVTGDPQDGQFGQLLPIRVARHLLPERLEGCADGVHPRPLPGVSQEPPGLLQGFDLGGGGSRFSRSFPRRRGGIRVVIVNYV